MKNAWINGSFTSEPGISPYDLGFLLGLGAFETLDGREEFELWPRHLDRLESAAELLGIPFEPPQDLRAAAVELLIRNKPDDALRITLTAGDGTTPTWCLTTRQAQRTEPVRLVVSPYRRCSHDPTAAIKCMSYAFYLLAEREARARGADEALLLGDAGHILETNKSNVFVVRGEDILTPSLNGQFLPGVARHVLMDAMLAEGRTVQEVELTLQDLRDADEILVTNAVCGPRSAELLDSPSAG